MVPSLENTSSSFDIRAHPLKLVSKFLVEDDEFGVGKIVNYERNKWTVKYKIGLDNFRNYNAVQMLERLEMFHHSYGTYNFLV